MSNVSIISSLSSGVIRVQYVCDETAANHGTLIDTCSSYSLPCLAVLIWSMLVIKTTEKHLTVRHIELLVQKIQSVLRVPYLCFGHVLSVSSELQPYLPGCFAAVLLSRVIQQTDDGERHFKNLLHSRLGTFQLLFFIL